MEVTETNSSASGATPAAPAGDAATPAAPSNPQNDDQHSSAQANGRRRGPPGREGHNGPKNWMKKQRRNREDNDGASNKRDRDRRPTKRPRFERDDQAAAAAAGGAEGEGEGAAEVRQSNMRIPFSAEEIAAEERRPKRKVAVMIGYAGTGYRGMQINHDEKTIEGDLFAAFVAAGAIAKANADDPKKSTLVRCARTDKGVHAAGNVISLKLIVEDEDIVERINAHLPPQIRIWGIRRTINSFSCYQACDSRWYEYLLPSYALLPPHPDSFLGKQMVTSARKVDEAAAAAALADPSAAESGGAYDEMMRRLDDVRDFWANVERDVIQPFLDGLDPDVRKAVDAQLHSTDEFKTVGHRSLDDLEKVAEKETLEKAAKMTLDADAAAADAPAADAPVADAPAAEPEAAAADATSPTKAAIEQALRDVKSLYVTAKRQYRVTPTRLQQLQEALSQFEGTSNFHNYTVQKAFHDASAKRHIKSFVVNPEPIQIRDTQWLSLRVHGQSFMMHQIRKMVAMAVMLTRCGTPPGPAMKLSYGPRRISIPRAPGLGLLLERPVFDTYNQRAQNQFGKTPIDFGDFEEAIRAFKDSEIYSRIWDVEESQNLFHSFFHQLDNYHTSYYLWAISGGFDAAFERFGHGEPEPKQVFLPGDVDEEGDVREEGEGDG